MTPADILVHPRCRRCETTFPRRPVANTAACSKVRSRRMVETHEPAFELIHEREDGWYGVQDHENVHPGDQVELLIAGQWRTGSVERLNTLGFYVEGVAGGFRASTGLSRKRGVLWRWPQPNEKGWVGPFPPARPPRPSGTTTPRDTSSAASAAGMPGRPSCLRTTDAIMAPRQTACLPTRRRGAGRSDESSRNLETGLSRESLLK